MARRTLRIVTVLSTALLAAAIMLFIAGYFLSPWDHYASLNNSLHVGVWNSGLDSRIVFFNDAEYGPYRGSIIGLVDGNGNVHPPLEREGAFGDSWGIYYRYFQWSDATLWTLAVTLWYPIAIFAIVPTMRFLCCTFCRRATRTA